MKKPKQATKGDETPSAASLSAFNVPNPVFLSDVTEDWLARQQR